MPSTFSQQMLWVLLGLFFLAAPVYVLLGFQKQGSHWKSILFYIISKAVIFSLFFIMFILSSSAFNPAHLSDFSPKALGIMVWEVFVTVVAFKSLLTDSSL